MAGEPTLFVKYSLNKLNIMDTEKQELTLKSPVQLDQKPSGLLGLSKHSFSYHFLLRDQPLWIKRTLFDFID